MDRSLRGCRANPATFSVRIALAVLVVVAAPLALADQASKQTELMRLYFNTGELKTFTTDVKASVAAMKAAHPEAPDWYWVSFENDVDVNAYSAWLDDLYGALSEDELKELNGVFGTEGTKAVYEEMNRIAQKKKGDAFRAAVDDMRGRFPSDDVDVVLKFAQSQTFRKYTEISTQKEASARAEYIKLMVEANARLRDSLKKRGE